MRKWGWVACRRHSELKSESNYDTWCDVEGKTVSSQKSELCVGHEHTMSSALRSQLGCKQNVSGRNKSGWIRPEPGHSTTHDVGAGNLLLKLSGKGVFFVVEDVKGVESKFQLKQEVLIERRNKSEQEQTSPKQSRYYSIMSIHSIGIIDVWQ